MYIYIYIHAKCTHQSAQDTIKAVYNFTTPSAPAKARNVHMERQSKDAETGTDQMGYRHTTVIYEMQENYVEGLQTAQTMCQNQRWVLSMPMCLCCTFANPTLEVMITLGLCVRRFEHSSGSTWTHSARYGAYRYKHAFDISLIQCAGIRRWNRGRKRWQGWNWFWTLENPHDLI